MPANLPPKDETWYGGLTQESDSELKHLRGKAELKTSEMVVSADEIDFNSDTNWAQARGHVHLEHFVTGDKVNADHAEYNIKTRNGKFYQVSGTSPAKIVTAPGVLTTTNPFYFEAEWAERLNDRYILHHGFLTDCHIPKPWWTFHSPLFDVIPGDRAIGRNNVFELKKVPIFYLPYYYRPLGKKTRQSGFLTPEVGNSSRFGYLYGGGYYWAVNPSYDMTGTVRYMTERGPAYLYDFRGKPNRVTDFDFNLYGVMDSGLKVPLNSNGSSYENIKQGGLDYQVRATTEIAGFTGHLDFNYLSSLLFREVFSYNFNTAIYNQVDSVGFLQRRFHSDRYTLSFVAQRIQIFETLTQAQDVKVVINGQTSTQKAQVSNEVLLQKLPSAEFNARDQQLTSGPLPVVFSFAGSESLLERKDPFGIETGGGPPQYIFRSGAYSRLDLEPRVATNYQFKGFSLTPSITLGATDYSNSYAINSTTYLPSSSCFGFVYCPNVNENLASSNLFRKDADFVLDLRSPALEKIFTPPQWLHLGAKLKHVVEVEARYENVTGIDQFHKIIQYDETDLLSNTNQLTFYLTNRIFRKDKNGIVQQVFNWRVAYARFYDPTFGGAVLAPQPGSVAPGYRNVVLASADLSPFPFLDGPRSYSPIVSSMQLSPYPFLVLDWTTDYDPLRHKFTDQTYTLNYRYKNYFASFGQAAIQTNPVLIPQANQISYGAGYGSSLRRGWNVSATFVYDVYRSLALFEFVTATYNTDCCGFGMRYQHINFGARQNENLYLFSFSVANIGTFGSLQRQQRTF